MDIIAQKGNTLAIVEVKWHSNTYFGDPQSFVSKKQQRPLITAANRYVNFNNLDVSVRFDVVSNLVSNPKSTFKLSIMLSIHFSRCVIYNKLFNFYYFRGSFFGDT